MANLRTIALRLAPSFLGLAQAGVLASLCNAGCIDIVTGSPADPGGSGPTGESTGSFASGSSSGVASAGASGFPTGPASGFQGGFAGGSAGGSVFLGPALDAGAIFGPLPNADFSVCGATSGTAAGSGASSGSFVNGGFGMDASGPAGKMLPEIHPTFGPTVTAASAPPPISGGTLLALGSGKVAVAADPDRDAVYVVDTSAATLLHTIALQPGDEPGRLVEDGAGRVHVAVRSGGALVTVDPMAGTVLGRRDVCPAPRGVAWDPGTDRVWVACATGELVAFPAAGGPATTRWVIERDLRDVLLRNGAVSVTKFRSAEILRIANDGTVSRRDSIPSFDPVSQPHVLWRAVQMSSNETLIVHQDHSKQSIGTHGSGGYGTGPNGVVSSRCTMMNDDGSEDGTRALMAPPFGQSPVLPVDIAISPDGTTAAVVSAGDGFSGQRPELQFISLSSGQLNVSHDAGPSLFLSAPTASCPSSPPSTSPGPVDAGVSLAAAFDAGSTSGSASAGPAMSSPSPSPPSMSTPPTSSAFVVEQPIAVAFDGSGHVLVQMREPASLHILGLSGLCQPTFSNPLGGTVVALSTISRDDTGHDIFHAAAGAAIACASCHPEGGDDGHVWILDGNARRTPSLRGTIAGTAPYHWPGDQVDFGALAADVYTGRMGGQMLPSDKTSALMGWVQAIPAPPAPSWVDAAAAQRGKAIFERSDTACASCHSGPKLTNNQTVNVGTCGAFQVPPLVGVGWRAPFMHNGCAAALGDRFAKCSTPGHGLLKALTGADIGDLTAYLETL